MSRPKHTEPKKPETPPTLEARDDAAREVVVALAKQRYDAGDPAEDDNGDPLSWSELTGAEQRPYVEAATAELAEAAKGLEGDEALAAGRALLTPATPTDEELAAAIEANITADGGPAPEGFSTPTIDPAAIGRGPGVVRALVQPHGRLVAGKPSTEDLEDLLAHFGMGPEHVLDWKGKPEEGLVVVTAGSEKITWPQDVERVIPRARLTGVLDDPKGRPGRVFPDGYLRRDASKDPA